MKTLFLTALAAATFIGCQKHHPTNTTTNKTDVVFMQKASYSNLAEIDAGTIAAARANNDSVKMFGAMMVNDHGKAEASLQALASELRIDIPDMPDSVHQAKAALLKTLSGYTFDTAYINAQVKDHLATIAVFQTELSDGYNPSVKKFATTNLPVIQMHLQEALDIQSQLE